MFPPHSFSETTINQVKAFVKGEMDISDFMAHYKESKEISNYLEWVIDCITLNDIPIKRRIVLIKNVNQNKPFPMRSYAEQFIKEYALSFRDLSEKWKENPPKVGEYLLRLSPITAMGAFRIHAIVADIYYQIDPALERTQRYHEEYEFSLDILPSYLAGGISAENYVSRNIISKYPASMKKGERKRLIKEEIKNAFKRDCKGFPCWIQMPEWPIGKDEKPMIYVGQKVFEHHSEYYFRDGFSGEKQTVTQQW